jgi:hypothetical protein
MVIRRIDPLSCAKIAGLLYAVLGLVAGGFFSLIMTTVGTFAQDEPFAGMLGMAFGAGAIVFLPISTAYSDSSSVVCRR